MTFRIAAALALVLCATVDARAESACPTVDASWFNRVASGASVSYGFSVDGTIQPSGRGGSSASGTPVSSIGFIKLLGTSVIGHDSGAIITGNVSGTETQNIGGELTTVSVDSLTSSFTIDTRTCTGTLTRTFTTGAVATWQIVVVDGDNTIRFMDTRANPAMRTGVLQMMR